jgi:hypothetical protein
MILKNTWFPLSRRSMHFSVGKKCAFPGAFVVAVLPDTLVIQFFQEFSIGEEVGGSAKNLPGFDNPEKPLKWIKHIFCFSRTE